MLDNNRLAASVDTARLQDQGAGEVAGQVKGSQCAGGGPANGHVDLGIDDIDNGLALGDAKSFSDFTCMMLILLG